MSTALGCGINALRGGTMPRRSMSTSQIATIIHLDFESDLYQQGEDFTTLDQVNSYNYTRSGAKIEELASKNGAPLSFAANVPGVVPDLGYWVRSAAQNRFTGGGAATNLATQTLTVTTGGHQLSFMGTGSITLSGGYTGVLQGTGEWDLVNLAFTPSTTSVTFTVSGDVRYAMLNRNAVLSGPITPTLTALDKLLFNLPDPMSDIDLVMWAKFRPIVTGGTRRIFHIGTDATTNSIYLQINSTGALNFAIWKDGVATGSFSPDITADVGQDCLVVMRRLDGAWELGEYADGEMVWAPGSTVSEPPALSQVALGLNHVNNSSIFNGVIKAWGLGHGRAETDEHVIELIQPLA